MAAAPRAAARGRRSAAHGPCTPSGRGPVREGKGGHGQVLVDHRAAGAGRDAGGPAARRAPQRRGREGDGSWSRTARGLAARPGRGRRVKDAAVGPRQRGVAGLWVRAVLGEGRGTKSVKGSGCRRSIDRGCGRTFCARVWQGLSLWGD